MYKLTFRYVHRRCLLVFRWALRCALNKAKSGRLGPVDLILANTTLNYTQTLAPIVRVHFQTSFHYTSFWFHLCCHSHLGFLMPAIVFALLLSPLSSDFVAARFYLGVSVGCLLLRGCSVAIPIVVFFIIIILTMKHLFF